MPNDEPAKYEFGLYDNFLKMGLISLLLSFVMFSFVMRSAIARWLRKEKNSNIAFRRNFYCIAAFFFFYYLLHCQTVRFQEVYPQIAHDKNIQGAPAEAPIDFGRRYLQEFDLNDYFKKVNENMQKRFAQFNKEMEEQLPQEETPEAQPQESQFVKDTMDKLRPWIEKME